MLNPAERPGRQLGVRAWSVLVAVVVVLVALVLGGTGLVYALQGNLEQAAESNARARATEVVALIDSEGATETAALLADSGRTSAVVQLVSADGQILGASNRSAQSREISIDHPAVRQYTSTERNLPFLDDGGEWKVVTTAVSSAGRTYYVAVAVPIRVERDTVQTVALFLLGGTPLLLGAVALAVWLLVGRALRSVEKIRATVADLDAHRLAGRVEVPPTHDEIAALAVTMNTMLDRLQGSQHAQRAFVSDASHELRSPLATLTTAGELALRSDEGARTRLLGTMNSELVRMRGLVENLMTLARADSHQLATTRAEVDLDDLVGREAQRIRLTSTRAVQVDLEPVRVSADAQSVAQALRNLVDNAERHASSTIRLSLRAQDGQAVVWVDNDGPVIAPADRERIFERFVRMDDSRSRDAGGSGLGLSISRAGLRAQSGDVSVVDAPDGWCRFELRLPVDD